MLDYVQYILYIIYRYKIIYFIVHSSWWNPITQRYEIRRCLLNSGLCSRLQSALQVAVATASEASSIIYLSCSASKLHVPLALWNYHVAVDSWDALQERWFILKNTTELYITDEKCVSFYSYASSITFKKQNLNINKQSNCLTQN